MERVETLRLVVRVEEVEEEDCTPLLLPDASPELQQLQGLDMMNVDLSLAGESHGRRFLMCCGGRSF